MASPVLPMRTTQRTISTTFTPQKFSLKTGLPPAARFGGVETVKASKLSNPYQPADEFTKQDTSRAQVERGFKW